MAVGGCCCREAPLAIMSHLTFGCTVASFAEVSWWFGVGDGDVQLRALKVIVGTVHRRGSALHTS